MYIHYIYVYTHIYIQTYVYDFDGHVYAAAGDKLAVGQKSHRKGGLVGRKEEGADTVANAYELFSTHHSLPCDFPKKNITFCSLMFGANHVWDGSRGPSV